MAKKDYHKMTPARRAACRAYDRAYRERKRAAALMALAQVESAVAVPAPVASVVDAFAAKVAAIVQAPGLAVHAPKVSVPVDERTAHRRALWRKHSQEYRDWVKARLAVDPTWRPKSRKVAAIA